MAFLDRNGVKIYYETHGEGPALLLSHGYLASAQMWRGQVDAFSKNYKLVLWDMRGHGRSDYPEDQAQYSEDATVDDMAAILDAIGAQSAIVGGLSLGGYMSLAFQRKYSERTRALLIVDTGPGYKNDDARAQWNERAVKTAERFEREGVSQSGGAETREALHRNAIGLALAGRGMLTQRNARVIESLPNIKVPSLIVVGANDMPFLKAADYMSAKIPNAQKVVISGAGHAANIDQPAVFNDAILNFLTTAVGL